MALGPSQGSRLVSVTRTAIAAAVLVVAGAADAPAQYVGDAFLRLPGLTGDRSGGPYKDWITTSAHYWKTTDGPALRRSARRGGQRLGGAGLAFFGPPPAPRKGASVLYFSIDKRSPMLASLMERCAGAASLADATFAVSSDLLRLGFEIGPRPVAIPDYFEFKLTDATFTDCPVVADAPEQAYALSFQDIAWLNYQGEGEDVTLTASSLQPAKPSPKTRSFVLTWLANANYVNDGQCKSMMPKPTEDDYYALVSKEEAARERAKRGDKGVSFQNEDMARRGPNKLNACSLPGIVKNPGDWTPVADVARGINLDGHDGTGNPPPGVRPHKNYISEDGEKGIDNQYFTAAGCSAGYQGEKGFMMQFVNNQMHDGILSILLEITGIDSEQNDDSVNVTVFYSKDPMQKNATGSAIAPDYTFRVTDEIEFTHYVRRLRGRIVNGVLTTDPVKQFQMNLTTYGTPSELTFADSRMRLKFLPDGKISGVVGGYMDWRRLARGSSVGESYFNFNCPGLYHALKNAADGIQDPVSGQYHGISAAFYMEGIPAFIGPSASRTTSDSGKQPRQQAKP